MKNKFIVITMLIITGSVHAKVINISRDNPHTFSLVSPHRKRPIGVHKQNEDYLKISCKPVDSLQDQHIHSCTIKPKSGAPEGTFALFKKTLKDEFKSLFHVSIEI